MFFLSNVSSTRFLNFADEVLTDFVFFRTSLVSFETDHIRFEIRSFTVGRI